MRLVHCDLRIALHDSETSEVTSCCPPRKGLTAHRCPLSWILSPIREPNRLLLAEDQVQAADRDIVGHKQPKAFS